MVYTLGQAAKATGKTKTAIANAIKNGRISANKDDSGRYQIDPAELHRVYGLTVNITPQVDDARPKIDPMDPSIMIDNATLKARVRALEDINRQIEDERDNLREQNTRITALLAAPKPDTGTYDALLGRLDRIEQTVTSQAAPRGLIGRLFDWRVGK
jgi:hypothetical protein